MPPAARITDFHACPMVTPGTPPIPHVGGPVIKGSLNVLTGKLPQARVGDQAVCIGPLDVIVKGSSGVFVNKLPAARIGDPTAHGGTIVAGLPTVIIGETKGGGGGGAAQVVANVVAHLVAAGVISPVSIQNTQVTQQVDALQNAARQGTPFVEPCFEPALAKPATTAKSTPPARSPDVANPAPRPSGVRAAPTSAHAAAQYQLGATSKQRLANVDKGLADVVRRAIEISKVDFTVVEGLRTQERQNQLYAQGRTAPGPVVTQTLKSKHIEGKAVDLAPLRGGAIDWNDTAGFKAIADAMFAAAEELGVSIDWGGSWKGFVDSPHFEVA